MRVRVAYTVEVDDDYRREINRWYGRPGLATREQVRNWLHQFGASMDDDLSLQADQRRDGDGDE